MSAVKLIFKRSSILRKRPTSANLEVGEIGLNTNAREPGLFFETTDGNTVKVGPTAVDAQAPTSSPERGELWYDTEDGSLNVGNAERQWRAIASPYLGGGGNVVFWAPEFKYSTDSILNDGQTLPFQTLTRAILELSKLIIKDTLAGYSASSGNNRYTVYFSSSAASVNNEPGVSVANFTTNLDGNSDSYSNVTIQQLIQFNPEISGGVICPRGISLVAMDQRKCEIHPTYVPSYINPSTPGVGEDYALSSVLLLTGNLLHDNFTIRDKIDSRDISSIRSSESGAAIFTSFTPHGLTPGELVSSSFASTVDTSTGTFTNGAYYATPINTYDFYLGASQTSPYVSYSTLPSLVNHTGIVLTVTNSNSSAHRLAGYRFLGLSDLADYYTKVQLAFPTYFGGTVTDGERIVSSPEYVLVGSTTDPYPGNTSSNTTSNASPYLRNITVRSNYGMCGGDFDGTVVSGFRSVIANSCTVVSIQNDPAAYEIYTTLVNPATNAAEQRWWPLTLATYLTTPASQRPISVALTPVQDQLNLLNSTPIPNIRYYYETLKNSEGKSFGVTDQNNDFRHFGFRVKNAAYLQAQSVYTVGCAVGAWALNGGILSLTNSTSNFGSVAIKAEGFNGINTIGGAYANGRGFLFEGIRNPLSLSQPQVEDSRNKEILTLGSRIISVSQELDESGNTTGIQLLTLSSTFSPCFLLPYSLKPGSAIWVATDSCTYRAFLATDGNPTVQPDPAEAAHSQLRVRSSDSTIPSDPALITSLGIPYIRRFIDPRSDSDRTYSFKVRNTNPNAVAPQIGSVLRLNQTSQSIGSATLRPNVQLDPGNLGGWGRVFTVDNVISGSLGSSPQFNYVISDNNQDTTYYLSVTASDYDRPWLQIPDRATGSYTTFENRNWYCAENNLWDSVYYETSFSSKVGPEKIAPTEPCSPFVTTSPLERQELVSLSYQGEYAPDPYLSSPEADVYETFTYFRGATSPYSSYPVQNYYDDDDSSDGMGLCLKNYIPTGAVSTQTVTNVEVIQTERFASLTGIYRPAVIQFSVLSSVDIPNPKQTVVVLRLGTSPYYEYVRVISLLGSQVKAIRLNSLNSFYVDPNKPAEPPGWVVGTVVTPCLTNTTPHAAAYDPDWSPTKFSLFRFFEVMGYSNAVMTSYLGPRFWGDREFPISSLPSTPVNGYAIVTGQWPLEFNEPSTVLANTHTWYNAGYLNYSRGLPRYQTTDLPRKLAADYQATTVWGGRISVEGVDNKGQVIKLGPEVEALTSQLASQSGSTLNVTNQELYEQQPYVQFPNQVIVYSVDNISSQFNGSQRQFNLTRGGLVVPPSQLSADSLVVSLGAVVQAPGVNYVVNGSSILFEEAPVNGTVCDIRVITSEDNESTLVVVPLTLIQPIDGVTGSFTAVPAPDLSTLDDISSQFNGTDLSFELKYQGSVVPYSQLNTETLIVTLNGVVQNLGVNYELIGSFIVFTTAPLAGTICTIRAISSTFVVPTQYMGLGNIFMFLGGVEQIPGSAYTLVSSSSGVEITFLGEAPPLGTTLDLRVVCSGLFWTTRTLQPVAVYSLDTIAPYFDGAVQTFTLTAGGLPINPNVVNAENLFVSVGGALQLPGISYTVSNSQITFTEAPLSGTTSNLRIVTNAEFITCPQPGFGQEIQQWGLPLTQIALGQTMNQVNDFLPPG